MKNYVKKFENFNRNTTLDQFIAEVNNDLEVLSYEIIKYKSEFLEEIPQTESFFNTANIADKYFESFITTKETLENWKGNVEYHLDELKEEDDHYSPDLYGLLKSITDQLKTVVEKTEALKALSSTLKEADSALSTIRK